MTYSVDDVIRKLESFDKDNIKGILVDKNYIKDILSENKKLKRQLKMLINFIPNGLDVDTVIDVLTKKNKGN